MATQFVQDLLLDPKSRDVTDITHVLQAVASSTSLSRAQSFITNHAGPDSKAVGYASYKDLCADSEVDAVYIATPTSSHYEDVLLCLNAGKHVLCEVGSSLLFPSSSSPGFIFL